MVRFKCRHLLVELIFDPPPGSSESTSKSRAPNLSERDIANALRENVVACFGDVGASTVTSIKYYSPATHLAIVRVGRDGAATLWASITLLRSIKGVTVCPRVLHNGGTIRKTQQEAVKEGRRRVIAAGAIAEQGWATEESAIMALQA